MPTTHPDYLALLAAVCAAPDDDAPRLVLADWFDENGEPERAEFIRMQVRLAELGRVREKQPNLRMEGMELFGYRTAMCQNLKALAAMLDDRTIHERDCELCLERRAKGLADSHGDTWASEVLGIAASFFMFRRGFLDTVSMAADLWLARGDALSWSPEQTEPCPDDHPWIGHPRGLIRDHDRDPWRPNCDHCKGTGRVAVPCPPTAQPVTEVRLTTRPEWEPVGPGAGCRLVGDPERRAYTSSDHSAAGLRDGPLGTNLLKLRWPAVKAWHLPPAGELPNPADIWLRRERRGPAALR